MNLHIYSAELPTEEEAFRFVSDMDFNDDESKPELWKRVGAEWLDNDFIETIYGEDRFEYLGTVLKDSSKSISLSKACPDTHNTLFLIFGIKGTSNEDFHPKECNEPLYLETQEAEFK